MSREWNAKWISCNTEDRFHPVFKKSIPCVTELKKATLFITGVGLFEAYINGHSITEEYLTPYLNDYQTGVQYFEYDVTEALAGNTEESPSVLEVMLGNGWYKGRYGFSPFGNLYGDRFALLSELVLETSDDTLRVGTDETWTYRGSDVENSGIYDGEIFNRLLWEGRDNQEKPAVLLDKEIPVVERYSLPVVVKETLPVREVIHTPAGETVFDFGQNFAGYVTFFSKLQKGERLHLEFGEVLQGGNFYNDNYRSAKGGFCYISDGRSEEVRPHFSYFSGRYVKVSGAVRDLNASDFTGCVVYSDMERTGFIETSNRKINRLFENALWSQKCNFIDIPTDCPQRDERLAWTGDINVFAKTASYNMDTKIFLMKFLRDLRAQQIRDDGAVAAFLPAMGDSMVSSVWGDAATFIPWTLYQMYGDTDILRINYSLMKDWVDYIDRQDAARGERRYLYDFGFHFGDWLAMDGSTEHSMKGGTEDYFISSAYYYASTEIVSEAAKALGRASDAAAYKERSEKIKRAFLDEYYTKTGRLSIDTQAAYVVALRFGLYPDKERVLQAFRNRLKKDCYRIKCGFVGGTYLCMALGENGMEDLAYQFLLNEDYPGWLYEVNLGATTIWERWNTILPDGTINPSPMNSCNHYSYGAVIDFLYEIAGGIRPGKPGFSEIDLRPVPDKRLRQFSCRYLSVKGEIKTSWKVNADGTLQFHFEIPEEAKAFLRLPYVGKDSGIDEKHTLLSGSYDFCYAPDKDFVHRFQPDCCIKEIVSDQEALSIVAEIDPALAGALQNGDEETGAETLFAFTANPFAPGTVEEAREIFRRLEKLQYF